VRDHVRVGDFLEVSSPRGTFLLQSGEGPWRSSASDSG
jgi:ferredoxin-NADP reductase